eukprot:SAG31_NODE_20_length_34168_cov_33.651296_1_plen_71_part_00
MMDLSVLVLVASIGSTIEKLGDPAWRGWPLGFENRKSKADVRTSFKTAQLVVTCRSVPIDRRAPAARSDR